MAGVQPTALAIDSSEPARIYGSTYNRGLWRSDDAGDTWRPVGTPQSYYGPPTSGAIGPRETTFVSAAPRPDARGRHAVWVGTETSSLYRSDDHGDTFRLVTAFENHRSRSGWSFPPRPGTHHVRWIAHGEDGRIYVSIEFGALLRSLDGGATFDDRLAVRIAASIGPRAAHGDNGPAWKSAARSALSRLRLVRDVDGPSSIFRREGDAWIEDADGFPRDRSLIPVLAADPHRPGHWFALSNLGLFTKTGFRSLAPPERRPRMDRHAPHVLDGGA